MGEYTPKLGLYKPDVGETNWGDKVNQNFDILDQHTHDWDEIENKPSTFPPSEHSNHPKIDINGVNVIGSDRYLRNILHASIDGDLLVSSLASIGGDLLVVGNASIGGSLVVGGTKSARIPLKSDTSKFVICYALESPFFSGVYYITKVRTQNRVAKIELPELMKQLCSDNYGIHVFVTPISEEPVKYSYTINDGKVVIKVEKDCNLDVMIVGRRWDTEVIEDVRLKVIENEYFGESYK